MVQAESLGHVNTVLPVGEDQSGTILKAFPIGVLEAATMPSGHSILTDRIWGGGWQGIQISFVEDVSPPPTPKKGSPSLGSRPTGFRWWSLDWYYVPGDPSLG